MRKTEEDKLLADLLRKYIADYGFLMTSSNDLCIDGWIEGCSPEQIQIVQRLMEARPTGGVV